MRSITLTLVLAAALAAGCAFNPPPVDLAGTSSDIQALDGEWTGSYTGGPHGRSGTLYFRLDATTDSAFGEVVMEYDDPGVAPVQDDPTAHRHDIPMQRGVPLTIAFVVAEGGLVSGELDPYADPLCGCRLQTRFVGELRDGVIEGSFEVRHLDTAHVDRGTWRAVRSPGR